MENTGRSAATNCKAYIISKNGKGRVCWVVPKERPNATINPEDSEGLDLCAFFQGKRDESVPQVIAPVEEGWPTAGKARKLDGITECEVLVTADNAKPVKAKVIFNLESKTINVTPY